jgi:Peptidase family M48
MKQNMILTTKRAVAIFEDEVSCRRTWYRDNEFFKVTDFLNDLCEDGELWKMKLFHTRDGDFLRPRASATEFAQNVRLTIDASLWSKAESGDKLANFILAHELGHIQLRHHATRHFIMNSGQNGFIVDPQDYFELEANFAAVVFQCGVALLDKSLSAIELANRAFCDVAQVKKAQAMVQLEVFRRELDRPKQVYPRVVL